MAWTAPTTRITGELVTASIWNTDIVDNLVFLKEGNRVRTLSLGMTGVTRSSTSWGTIDAHSATLTMSSVGTVARVHFSADVTFDSDNYEGHFDIDVDGTRSSGDSDGLFQFQAESTVRTNVISWTHLVTTATAGQSVIFKVAWKCENAALTMTMNNLELLVEEVG